MPPISSLIFQQRFAHFTDSILRASGRPFRSFEEGLASDWEGYKVPLRAIARERLGFNRWQPSEVGKGSILARVIDAIEIAGGPDVDRNNLVSWQPRWGAAQQSHRALIEAKADKTSRRRLEEVFHKLFCGGASDAAAFEAIVALVGQRYDLVAYLFYLKDATRFMPMAPRTFDSAFAGLGIGLRTSRKCSWDNYTAYNRTIAEVRDALEQIAGCRGARLIDAHSFCWILTRLEPATSATGEPLVVPPTPLRNLRAASADLRVPTTQQRGRRVADSYFEERQTEQNRLGALAERIALISEQARLRSEGRDDLAIAIESVSDRPGLGYDIKSFEADGRDRYIEVKAARVSKGKVSFFLTRNELSQSKELSNYYFYAVTRSTSVRPVVYALPAVEVVDDCLMPMNYLAALESA